jgi:ABC-2 type transport system ATP-binding protein
MARIELQELTKEFGSLTALDSVSLQLEKGQIVGLLGPNGSGKTTLIKILNGLLTPTAGRALINGMEPGVETKKIVAFLPDRNALPDYMTTAQLMDLYQDFFEDFNRGKAESMVADLGIDMKQQMKNMSKGTKEKLQLCLVMAREAQVYLLDEPIGGVDPATRDYILRTII